MKFVKGESKTIFDMDVNFIYKGDRCCMVVMPDYKIFRYFPRIQGFY